MNLSLYQEWSEKQVTAFCVSLTIVPYVINPTRAFGGSKLKLMMIESFSAFKLSSSWHVSTTKRKIGGDGAGRARRYSIVVFATWSSGGMASGEMSL